MIKTVIRALLNLVLLIAMFLSITYVFYLLITGVLVSFSISVMKEFILILALFLASIVFYIEERGE